MSETTGSGPGTPDVASSGGRGRRARAALAVVAAALALLALSSATWFSGTVPGAVQGEVPVAVSGAQVAPGLGGVALVLLAAGAALGLVGPAGRRVVGLVVALAGAAATALAVAAVRSPEQALREAAAQVTGVAQVPAGLTASPLGPVSVVACLGVVVLGLWHLSGRGAWSRPGVRHERRVPRAVDLEDPAGAWDALSEGEDPSESPASGER